MCKTAFTTHAGKISPEFLPLARSSLTLSAGRQKSAFSVCFQWSSGFRVSNCSVPNCNSPGPRPGNSYFRIPNMPPLRGRVCSVGLRASPAGALPPPLATGSQVFHPPLTPHSFCDVSVSPSQWVSLSQPVLCFLNGNSHKKRTLPLIIFSFVKPKSPSQFLIF